MTKEQFLELSVQREQRMEEIKAALAETETAYTARLAGQ